MWILGTALSTEISSQNLFPEPLSHCMQYGKQNLFLIITKSLACCRNECNMEYILIECVLLIKLMRIHRSYATLPSGFIRIESWPVAWRVRFSWCYYSSPSYLLPIWHWAHQSASCVSFYLRSSLQYVKRTRRKLIEGERANNFHSFRHYIAFPLNKQCTRA